MINVPDQLHGSLMSGIFHHQRHPNISSQVDKYLNMRPSGSEIY
jgi:hypothetical protein